MMTMIRRKNIQQSKIISTFFASLSFKEKKKTRKKECCFSVSRVIDHYRIEKKTHLISYFSHHFRVKQKEEENKIQVDICETSREKKQRLIKRWIDFLRHDESERFFVLNTATRRRISRELSEQEE